MEKLELEEWLESKPTDGFETVEQSLDCLFAETGQDREMDFDLEEAINVEYEKYLASL